MVILGALTIKETWSFWAIKGPNLTQFNTLIVDLNLRKRGHFRQYLHFFRPKHIKKRPILANFCVATCINSCQFKKRPILATKKVLSWVKTWPFWALNT